MLAWSAMTTTQSSVSQCTVLLHQPESVLVAAIHILAPRSVYSFSHVHPEGQEAVADKRMDIHQNSEHSWRLPRNFFSVQSGHLLLVPTALNRSVQNATILRAFPFGLMNSCSHKVSKNVQYYAHHFAHLHKKSHADKNR